MAISHESLKYSVVFIRGIINMISKDCVKKTRQFCVIGETFPTCTLYVYI